MGQRRKARELAAQILYAMDFDAADPQFYEYNQLNRYPELLDELSQLLHVENSPLVLDFADDLVKNVIINQDEIRAEIDKHSEHWSPERIARLDRSILRLAVYELVYTDTPAAVVINEAIEIAKKFCGEGSRKFINGVLDAVHREMQERERLESTRV